MAGRSHRGWRQFAAVLLSTLVGCWSGCGEASRNPSGNPPAAPPIVAGLPAGKTSPAQASGPGTAAAGQTPGNPKPKPKPAEPAELPWPTAAIPRGTLMLSSYEPKDREPGMLLRELARQAVLIAAREDLGQRTRDIALREFSVTREGTKWPLEVQVANNAGRVEVTLAHRQGAELHILWDRTFVFDRDLILEQATEKIGTAARGELIALLKKEGFEGTPNKPAATGDPVEETRRLLREMTFTSQFQLGGLSGIAELDLSGTAIGDASSDVLATLRSAERIVLLDTKVSAAAIDKLRAALPRCELVR